MEMIYDKESVLKEKGYAFAIRIVKMVKLLSKDRCLFSIYDQVLRSGTSISANIHEAEFAQSTSDFISKLSISLKEANETKQWLDLLKDTECITIGQHESMIDDCKELIALLVASIKTMKRNASIVMK